jgi:GT2 family glycosyltransferase
MAKVIAFTRRTPRSSPAPAIRAGNQPRSSSVISIAHRSVHTDPSAGSNILISVVVATCDRPHLLSHCLASLLWQRFDTSRYEIIVVDDKPSSCTRDIVTDWAMHAKRSGPKVTYIPSNGPHGLAAARNRGWRAARGAVIAFTNDDTVARADWLQNGWNAFEHDVQAAWGHVVVPYLNSSGEYERHMKNMERSEFTAANCFCRKQALQELGGFDERFELAWREDADLYFRLLGRANRVVHVASAVMTHPIRQASWGESLRQQKKVQADALLYKKHPELYRQKIRGSYHRDCYLIVAALFSFFIALAVNQTAVAIAAAATWLFLTGWFAVKRLAPSAKTAGHIAEMIVASVLLPPLAVFWRLTGAVKFRVPFL